ncbi:hypothetical protein EV359DRAFT_64383 [Lentinula novae-zelandiae]|nr:hypothetical protein EV359DRAFT_64383 [Lentinula novae-zelandiae]
MFASWDVTTRLTFNKQNNANNIRRDLQRAAHLRDPENIRSPSPVTSELTIQLEEWEKIRTNPIRFDSLKHLIPDFILEWMESRKTQEVKDKREREEDTSREAEEEKKKKKRRLAEPLVPVVKNPLVPFQASFHDALYEIAHVSPIPLPFFSNDALQFISACAHSLPHKKFKSNDPRKSGFETSRDPAGPAGTRAQFIILHFSFFLNKRHTAKLYAFWKPAELRIRNEQYLEFTGFIQSVYDSEWTKVESQFEFEDTMAKARGGSLWYSYPFQSNTTSDTSPPYQGSPIGDMPPLSENTITPDHTSVTNTQGVMPVIILGVMPVIILGVMPIYYLGVMPPYNFGCYANFMLLGCHVILMANLYLYYKASALHGVQLHLIRSVLGRSLGSVWVTRTLLIHGWERGASPPGKTFLY